MYKRNVLTASDNFNIPGSDFKNCKLIQVQQRQKQQLKPFPVLPPCILTTVGPLCDNIINLFDSFKNLIIFNIVNNNSVVRMTKNNVTVK